MSLIIVVAADENNAIGKDNRLMWHLPADLKRFKEITYGHPILMGRKTFDSIGKPLPGRTSIVISRQTTEIPGCICVKSIEEAILAIPPDEDAYFIGGAEIFKQVFHKADEIFFTRVHHTFEGDTFFPKILPDEWETVSEQHFEPDEKNLYPYSFIKFLKKN